MIHAHKRPALSLAVMRLLAHATIEDYAWLARGDSMWTNLYIVSDEPKGLVANEASPCSAPWPVVLTLGTRSTKHVFEHKGSLNMSRYIDGLVDFQRRVRWAYFFKDAQLGGDRPLMKKGPSSCQHPVPPEVGAYLLHAERVVRAAVQAATLRYHRPWPAHLRFTRRWLEASNLRCELSDKDGVFTLVPQGCWEKLVWEQLSKPCYAPISSLSLVVRQKHMLARALDLAGRLKSLGKEAWAREVVFCVGRCASDESSAYCDLRTTIKTHKPLGQLAARPIHAARSHMLNALGAVINRLLGPKLASLNHVVTSSEGCQQALLAIKCSRHSLLMKFDVKDFYLSGSHDDLALLISDLFVDEDWRRWVSDCLGFLLSNQLVRWSGAAGTLFEVTQGSGMGMKAAGAISDLAFWASVEKPLFNRLPVGPKLCGYIRFRDDVFAIVDNHIVGNLLGALFRKHGRMFKVTVDEVSPTTVTMLDLRVHKLLPEQVDTQNCSLGFSPFIKPSARHIPLGPSSAHPAACMRAWPRAELLRMRSRSSCVEAARAAQERKIRRFELFFLDRFIPRDISAEAPCRSPCAMAFTRLISSSREHDPRTIRLVLPWSGRLCGFSRAWCAFNKRWGPILAQVGLHINVQVAWSRASRALASLIRA